jgi:hypothetical protein
MVYSNPNASSSLRVAYAAIVGQCGWLRVGRVNADDYVI